eukprot:1588969-Rhodomonas_salina.1
MVYFILYETRQQFVLVAADRQKEMCAILRIDRSFPSSLVFGEGKPLFLLTAVQCTLAILTGLACEDQRMYTWQECEVELELLNSANSDKGGLRKVGDFYGLVGFIKFTSCFYMGLINKRTLVGVVAGHEVYSVDTIQYFQCPGLTQRATRQKGVQHADTPCAEAIRRSVPEIPHEQRSHAGLLLQPGQRTPLPASARGARSPVLTSAFAV